MASKPNKYDDHKTSRYTLAEVEDPKVILVQLGMPSKSKNKVLDREFKSKIIDFLASHSQTQVQVRQFGGQGGNTNVYSNKSPNKKIPSLRLMNI